MYYPDPNDYTGSDIEKIQAAIEEARNSSRAVRIPCRKKEHENDRDFWLIDSAIILPENMTLIVSNTRIKLSDVCRDNFIRSGNCIIGQDDVETFSNIHIIGEGKAVFEGADHPRATGDGNKVLTIGKIHGYPKDGDLSKRPTYGTDAGKEGETQVGDWRNIGILLVKVTGFSIQNVTVRNPHCWGISLEYCEEGLVRDVHFEEREHVLIDGYMERCLNRDGLDLRRGCRNISIENITGLSGDDLIALTAIGTMERKTGEYGRTEFRGGNEDRRKDDVYNISIRNIRGGSSGGYYLIRFLNQKGVRMYNIQVTGVLDTAPCEVEGFGAVKLGDPAYGGASKPGETCNFLISDVQTHSKRAIVFGAPLEDSMISNILYFKQQESYSLIGYHNSGPQTHEKGVIFNNLVTIDRTQK